MRKLNFTHIFQNNLKVKKVLGDLKNLLFYPMHVHSVTDRSGSQLSQTHRSLSPEF